MKKATISLGGILRGRVDVKGTKIIIPFTTGHSKFSRKIPRVAKLIFESYRMLDGSIEYRFSGVDAKCYCKDCTKK